MDKKDARRAAARLRNLGKVAIAPRTDEDRFREAQQSLRSEDAYADAPHCPACALVREQSGDGTALCPSHLSKAMGL